MDGWIDGQLDRAELCLFYQTLFSHFICGIHFILSGAKTKEKLEVS